MNEVKAKIVKKDGEEDIIYVGIPKSVAEAFCMIGCRVGGDPELSRRGDFDRLYNVLQGLLNFDPLKHWEEVKVQNNSLYFNNAKAVERRTYAFGDLLYPRDVDEIRFPCEFFGTTRMVGPYSFRFKSKEDVGVYSDEAQTMPSNRSPESLLTDDHLKPNYSEL